MKPLIVMMYSFALFCSCNRPVSAGEFVAQVNDPNGRYNQSAEGKAYAYLVKYKPAEYMALMELKGTKSLSDSLVASHTAGLEENEYFTLAITPRQNAVEAREHLKAFMAKDARSNVLMVVEKDTIAPLAAYYESSFGIDKGEKLLLAFRKHPSKSGRVLWVNGASLGDERLTFKFSRNTINHKPNLQL